MKIAVIGLPGKWSSEVLADAVFEKTGFRLIVDMSEVVWDLETRSLRYRDYNLCEFNALIVKKISAHYSPNTLDRLELLRIAENRGVRVFSGVNNMLRLIDRLSCTVTLANADIPMPPTRVTESVDEAAAIVETFDEAIFKPLYSTKARGMCVIKAKDGSKQIKKDIATFQADNPMMYIQKKMDLGGQDLGLVFLAGRYLGAYARVSKNNSWNTTINSGGSYEKASPSADIIALAEKAQSLFHMDFTTVDVAETENGAIVFEVSAFGGFRGAKEGIGIDAAELYVDYVLNILNQ